MHKETETERQRYGSKEKEILGGNGGDKRKRGREVERWVYSETEWMWETDRQRNRKTEKDLQSQFQTILQIHKNRKATIFGHCFSSKKTPEIVDFDAAGLFGGIIHKDKKPGDSKTDEPR